jgi:hypothetical protein
VLIDLQDIYSKIIGGADNGRSYQHQGHAAACKSFQQPVCGFESREEVDID